MQWLEDVYQLVAHGDDEKAGNIVFTKVFDCLENPEAIDDILREVDFDRLNILLVLSVLGASNPVKKQLKERPKAIKRARVRLSELAPDRVDALLAGLE